MNDVFSNSTDADERHARERHAGVQPSQGVGGRPLAAPPPVARMSWPRRFGIGFSAATGTALLLLADIGLKEHVSAFKQIRQGVNTHLAVEVPPICLVLLFMVLAVAVCFIFDQRTAQGGFYTGASLFSIMATLTPGGEGLPAAAATVIDAPRVYPLAVSTLSVGLVVPASAAQPTPEITDGTEVAIRVYPGGELADDELPPTLVATLERVDQRTYRSDEVSCCRFQFVTQPGLYTLLVEGDGIRSAEVTFRVEEAPLAIPVTLGSSRLPGPLQFLFGSPASRELSAPGVLAEASREALEEMEFDSTDEQQFFGSIRDGNLDVVNLYLQANAYQTDYNPADEYGRNALMMAAEAGHLEIVQSLLAHGADVERSDHDGRRALHFAAERHPPIVRELLDAGADIDAQSEFGETPLMVASVNNADVVEILLGADARVDLMDDEGKTVLDWATEASRDINDVRGRVSGTISLGHLNRAR